MLFQPSLIAVMYVVLLLSSPCPSGLVFSATAARLLILFAMRTHARVEHAVLSGSNY